MMWGEGARATQPACYAAPGSWVVLGSRWQGTMWALHSTVLRSVLRPDGTRELFQA